MHLYLEVSGASPWLAVGFAGANLIRELIAAELYDDTRAAIAAERRLGAEQSLAELQPAG